MKLGRRRVVAARHLPGSQWRWSRVRTLNFVRSILPNAYAAKARGVVLCAITVGALYAYYLAVDADDAIPPAAADFIPVPPVIRAASITSPIYIIPDTAAQGTSGPAVPPRAQAAGHQVARDLQTALAKAHCYDGPVTGKWNAASQAAMGAFLSTVNAHLPVDDPDDALLALVSSNADVTCAPKPTIVADALDTSAAAVYEKRPQTKVAIAAESPASPSLGTVAATPAHERSMLDHPWAQPEMLIPAGEMTPPASATTLASTSSAEPAARDIAPAPSFAAPVRSVEAPSAPAAVMQASTAASDGSGIRFESGSLVSAEKPEIAAPSPSAPGAAPAKVTQRKAKSAKRRTSQSNDTSFGVSFDSIQRSLSSLFY